MITLATLNDATPQQVFDQIVKHLRNQNERSENEFGRCKYLQGDLKCAAGCFIDKHEYRKDMEGKMFFTIAADLSIKNNIDLITEFQRLHDRNHSKHWEEKFSKLAIAYKLNYDRP